MSLYIQITNRCNMTCKHCGFSCTRKGEDMTVETFRNVLKKSPDTYISIGGGEPTLHPLLFEFLAIAIGKDFDVWMATNGKIKERALMLHAMSSMSGDRFLCELSLDQWHDPINPIVVERFSRPKEPYSRPPIRKSDKVIPVGRGAKLVKANSNVIASDLTCVCPSVVVRPNGDVHICGCKESPKKGNVNDPKFSFECVDYVDGTCYKELEENA